MSSHIRRLLFWFKDGQNDLYSLNYKFFPLSLLLNRLLNETYKDKTINSININLYTEATYSLYPLAVKYHLHHTNRVISYDDFFDLDIFNNLTFEQQKKMLWERSREIFVEASAKTNNKNLIIAADYAYNKGKTLNLDTDFKILSEIFTLDGMSLEASVWIKFKDDSMQSIFSIEKGGRIIFEKFIDKSLTGNEFFLTIYKKIEIKNNCIIIKGNREIDYLPMKININEDIRHA
jgi:hypothetical protein